MATVPAFSDSNAVEQWISNSVPNQFEAYADYNAEGDCIELFFERESYFADRIDDLVTVYRERATNRIVGANLKGVSRFIKLLMCKAPGFEHEVTNHHLRVAYLLSASLWYCPNQEKRALKIYVDLRDQADKTALSVPYSLLEA